MRVLVLGGTKFIGPHIVRELDAGGHEVTVFHRGDHEADLPELVQHVHGDLSALDERTEQLRRLAPDVVLDMIPFRAEEGRRIGAFAGVARRAVVVSSADVYRAFGRLWRTEPGPPDPLPLTEDSPLREQLSNEGADYDKVGVEREAAHVSMPVAIVRLPAVHGPGDAQHRLYPYVKRMDDGRPAILLDDGLAGWRWVRGYAEVVEPRVALGRTIEWERANPPAHDSSDPFDYAAEDATLLSLPER